MSNKVDAVILMTHQRGDNTPHLQRLRESNPDVSCHIVVGEDDPRGKHFSWKNSDRVLRKWWLDNRDNVVGDTFAIIEWDTLVNAQLPEIPTGVDLAGKSLLIEPVRLRGRWRVARQRDPRWRPEFWMWWRETSRMPLCEGEEARGLVSFGFMLARRKVLDAVVEPKWDAFYKQDIQNELRFPTVAHLSGMTLGEIELPHVEFDDVVFDGSPGIWHGVPD